MRANPSFAFIYTERMGRPKAWFKGHILPGRRPSHMQLLSGARHHHDYPRGMEEDTT